jgi:hypothetical protein
MQVRVEVCQGTAACPLPTKGEVRARGAIQFEGATPLETGYLVLGSSACAAYRCCLLLATLPVFKVMMLGHG